MRWLGGLVALGWVAWFPSYVVDALAKVHAYEECDRLRELHRFVALDCPSRPSNTVWMAAQDGLAIWWLGSVLGTAALIMLVNKRSK